RLVALARSIEVFILPSNEDCATLANSLIERYHPLFNLATYLEPSGTSYITLTAEPYPRLVAGRLAEDGKIEARAAPQPRECFGPFPSATRDLLLKAVTENLRLRTCHPMPRRACISYQRKLCCAPCEGRVSMEEYAVRATQAGRFLTTPGPELIEALAAQMQSAAGALAFERAGRIHNQIEDLRPAIAKLAETRSRRRERERDRDAIYLANGKALIVEVRRGALRDMIFQDVPGEGEAGVVGFLLERYKRDERYGQEAPPELVMNVPVSDSGGLAARLSTGSGHPVSIIVPSDASAAAGDLLEIARANLEYRLGRSEGVP
ncbi:MAG: hypothetical protein EHM21_11205, partial [Chloroflexi bacterium]